MKNKALIIAVLLSVLNLSVFAAVDCSDPKNRPRNIGGRLIGGGGERGRRQSRHCGAR